LTKNHVVLGSERMEPGSIIIIIIIMTDQLELVSGKGAVAV